MKIFTKLRQEDYWLIPLAGVGVLNSAFALYAGITSIRFQAGIFGLFILGFCVYLLSKHYSQKAAKKFVILYVLLSGLFALCGYLLTN